jgi:regulator of protease activity HflC (stomatin/prohibitin superfamily)
MIKEMQRLKALCTRDEFALYRESLGNRLEQLSSRDLRSRIRRARNLRDKYNGAHRRQRSGERGKLPQDRSVGLSDFSGTWQKADLFQQVLGRFERRIDALEEKERQRQEESDRRGAGDRRQAGRTRRQVEAAQTDRESHRGRPKGDAGRRSQGAVPKGPGRAAQYAHGRGTAGHFGSANRRFQAHHDARR